MQSDERIGKPEAPTELEPFGGDEVEDRGDDRATWTSGSRDVLPARVAALGELSIHDGLIERLTVNETKRTVTLELVIGDLQRGYQRARIKYKQAALTDVCVDLKWLVAYEQTEILSGAVDVTERGFRHRLAFWPAGEIHVDFASLDIKLEDRPDRTRRDPRLRWR